MNFTKMPIENFRWISFGLWLRGVRSYTVYIISLCRISEALDVPRYKTISFNTEGLDMFISSQTSWFQQGHQGKWFFSDEKGLLQTNSHFCSIQAEIRFTAYIGTYTLRRRLSWTHVKKFNVWAVRNIDHSNPHSLRCLGWIIRAGTPSVYIRKRRKKIPSW